MYYCVWTAVFNRTVNDSISEAFTHVNNFFHEIYSMGYCVRWQCDNNHATWRQYTVPIFETTNIQLFQPFYDIFYFHGTFMYVVYDRCSAHKWLRYDGVDTSGSNHTGGMYSVTMEYFCHVSPAVGIFCFDPFHIFFAFVDHLGNDI